jgi:hypothetical protein
MMNSEPSDGKIETIISKANELSVNYIKMTQKLNEKSEDVKIIKQLQTLIKSDNLDVVSLLSQFSSLDEFLSAVGKELPENIYKVGNMFLLNDMSTQEIYNWESLFDLFEQEGHKPVNSPNYSFVTTSVEEIITNSEMYWKSLQLSKEEQINMKSEKTQKLDEFISKILKDVSTANNYWHKSLENQMKSCKNINEKIGKILYNYTTNDYSYINPLLVNKNPNDLKKMARYIHCIIYNYIHQIAGTKYTAFKELTRCVPIPCNTLELYKTNSLIFFTNLTSTSLEELGGFGSKKTNNDFSVVFKIRIKTNSFVHCGMSVEDLSQYKNEKEVLLLPYIIFKISKINKDTTNKTCLIELDELENRELIKKILEPKIIKFSAGTEIPKSELISAINEKMISISSEFKDMKINHNGKKNEFYQTMTQMIKENDLDPQNKKVMQALSSSHEVFCSGIYDEKSFKSYYCGNNPGNLFSNNFEESAIEEFDLNDFMAKPIQNILWIDDLIFGQSDTASLIQSISKNNSNINFICKTNTNDGLNILNSAAGKELLKHKNFRILQDMVRLNEPDKYYAGVNFVKAVRDSGIDREIMIFTSNKTKGENNFKERNVSLKNVFVTTNYNDVNEFILGKKADLSCPPFMAC